MPRGIPNQRDDDMGGNVTPEPSPDPEAAKVDVAKPDEKPAEKPETHAQKARKEADAAQAAAERDALDRAESFSVIFPTGISVLAPEGEHEVEVTVGGRQQWVDVENGFVHLPKGTLIRATTLAELEDLRQKARMRFVESILPEAP